MVLVISLVLVTCLITNSARTEAYSHSYSQASSIIFPDNDNEVIGNCLHNWDDKFQVCSEIQNCQGHQMSTATSCYDHCGDHTKCCSLEIDKQATHLHRDHPSLILVGELLENKKELNWKCGGSLIAPKFVLTSAHCLPLDDDVTYVRVTRRNPREHIVEQKFVFAEKIFIHPKFDSKSPFYFDVALLQLQDSIWGFKPVFLPTKESSYKFRNQTMHLMGWSKAPKDDDYKFANNTVEIVHNRKCSSYFRLPDLKHGIIENQICGNVPSGSSLAPCSGGKLGPLETSDHVIVGIPSFTFGCNNARPLVFTSIVFFTPWIRMTIESASVDHCGFPQRR